MLPTVCLFAVFITFTWSALSRSGLAAENADDQGWKLVSRSESVTIFNRSRKDSETREMEAIGLIEARPIVVKRVLDDSDEHTKFMPYVAESRVLSRKGDTVIGYQRLAMTLVDDRDYTIRIHFETRRTADGDTIYCNRWETASDLGPAERPGVVRVKVNEGYWLLEPLPGKTLTRATYCVFSECGGKLPASFVNSANRSAIPKLFDAIRKQAKLPKYSKGD